MIKMKKAILIVLVAVQLMRIAALAIAQEEGLQDLSQGATFTVSGNVYEIKGENVFAKQTDILSLKAFAESSLSINNEIYNISNGTEISILPGGTLRIFEGSSISVSDYFIIVNEYYCDIVLIREGNNVSGFNAIGKNFEVDGREFSGRIEIRGDYYHIVDGSFSDILRGVNVSRREVYIEYETDSGFRNAVVIKDGENATIVEARGNLSIVTLETVYALE